MLVHLHVFKIFHFQKGFKGRYSNIKAYVTKKFLFLNTVGMGVHMFFIMVFVTYGSNRSIKAVLSVSKHEIY